MVQFDNGYVLSLSNADVTDYDERISGPVLGNGKIVLLPRVTDIDTMHSMIGGEFPVRNGQYTGNLSPGFHFNAVDFFDMKNVNVTKELLSASLNMQSGIYTSSFRIKNAQSATLAEVSCDLYALRPYPYCVMQTFRVSIQRSTLADSATDPSIFHQVYALPSQVATATFNNNLIHSDSVGSGPALQVLTASGLIRPGGSDSLSALGPGGATTKLAASCVYLLEDNDECKFEVLGTNSFRYDMNRCYTKVKMSPAASSQTSGTVTFRFHILTATMTDADFPDPVEETKRIVLNLRNKATTPAAVAARLRTEHVRAWTTMWTSDIHIDPKTGISQGERARIDRHVQAIRYSLYSMYSCTREGVNVDVNPMNLSVADATGSSLSDGDLWTVPMLLLLKTDVARAMIEYKHKTISVATQLAASYGFKGAKFPYHTDVVGYQAALYWDAVSPLYVFNTCIVAMNAWNYYRVTRDRDWMYTKGYTILKQAADFLVSLVELADPANPDPQLAKQYVFRRVAGLSGVPGDDNALTVYTARVALRFALEASYDLQYPPRDTWLDVFQNTKVPFFGNALNDVIRLYSDFPQTATSSSPRPPILEVLLMLTPYYNAQLFGTDTRVTSDIIYKNLQFYKPLLPVDYIDHPVNMLLEAAMLGQLSQTDLVYTDAFYTKMDAILQRWTDGTWGNFVSFGSSPLDTERPTSTDLTLVGMYLLIFLQSLGGLRISGGVTETRFLYEEMRIRVNRAGVLPRTWRQLRIEGIGSSKVAATITNKVVYTGDG
jgi:hypothetical protein